MRVPWVRPTCSARSYAIGNASLVNLEDDGSIRKGSVCVRDGIISEVRVHPAAPPPGECFDAAGDFLLPGIIDAHVHLIWDGSPDPLETMKREGHHLAMARGIANAWQSLLRGVTTVRDLGSVDDVAVDIARAFESEILPGPTVVAAGRMLQPSGGHVPDIGLIADTDEELVDAVRRLKERGASLIKIAATGGAYGPEEIGPPLFSPASLRTIVEEARRAGLPVAAHALGREGCAHAVRAGVKTLEHGAGATEDSLREMKRTGAFLIPTLAVYRSLAESSGKIAQRYVDKARTVASWHAETIRCALDAGVPIALGTDAGSPNFGPHPSVFGEMEAMVDCGMSPREVLLAATRNAACAVGLGDSIGSVAVGYRADLVLMKENPLVDIRAMRTIRKVIKSGVML